MAEGSPLVPHRVVTLTDVLSHPKRMHIVTLVDRRSSPPSAPQEWLFQYTAALPRARFTPARCGLTLVFSRAQNGFGGPALPIFSWHERLLLSAAWPLRGGQPHGSSPSQHEHRGRSGHGGRVSLAEDALPRRGTSLYARAHGRCALAWSWTWTWSGHDLAVCVNLLIVSFIIQLTTKFHHQTRGGCIRFL